MNLVGKVLGNRYEIIEEIGVGGMATVYKAKCRLLNRNVAIKILKDEFANDSEFIKRFQIEAQAAASLSHPNIVSIYDVGNEDNLHYIVMELIEGKTLKEVINEKGKLDWREAADFAAQIAAGLSKAHANHIIHRDIKPHNIIITKDKVAKVTDFGIAKAVSNSTINAFGSTIGSVHYFSPEHARGGYTDEKSDIYSLGVVLYEMLTGKVPFDADSAVSIAMKHIQETPVEPIDINKEIPMGINDIVMKAMAKNISDRYQSANDMHTDLERILKTPYDIPNAVVSIRKNNEFPTQKIPIVGIENEETTRIKKITERKLNDGDDDEEVKKGITKKQAIIRLIVILLIAIALFFVAFKLGSYVLGNLLGGTKEVAMPYVVGDEETEAQRKIEEAGLVMVVAGELQSEEYPAGYIVKQYYNEGYKLKVGADAKVYVSKGAKKILVPNITNKTVDEAKIEVEQRNLTFAIEDVASETVEIGKIVSQSPSYNSEVVEGSVITAYVSKGMEDGLIKVPNVVGETEEVATKKISESKLIPEVTTISDASKKDGIVVSQSPEKDSVVSELTSIVLVVNKLSNNNKTESETNNKPADNNPLTNGKKRTININLSNKGSRENFVVKVVLQSTLLGTRVEYEGTHSRADGTIAVDITDAPGAFLRLYIDGVLDSEQVLK